MRSTSARAVALVLGCGVSVACGPSVDSPAPGSSGTSGAATGGASGNGVGGVSSGGGPVGGGVTAGSTTGGSISGGSGGIPTSGGRSGSNSGGGQSGGSSPGGASGSGSGGVNTGGGGRAAGGSGGSGGAGGGSPTAQPDCNAAMPSGGQLRDGNGTGGMGNLGWEIWSNTGQGQMTTFSVPAFVATWNNSGGYLGRLGFEWGGFQSTPVPHDERGTITAQFVSKKTGTAGGYSYVGMYGWTTNPCVEWYVVDDSYNTMPINPGSTTKTGEVELDGGTYIMYTRPTTGTGGTRCDGTTNWMQYYSVRKTARACGVISLSEHFKAWQGLGMDMTGELLEAKILVEVGGGVGNVQLPIANVVVQ